MSSPSPAPDQRTGSPKGLLVWAILATVAAAGFAASSVVLFFQLSAAHEQAMLAPPPPPAEPEVPKLPAETRDFSTSNTVSLLLGVNDAGDGLRHLDREKDGMTTVETWEGATCRHLDYTARGRTMAYVYFTVHPTFKNGPVGRAVVEVDYLDPVPGLLTLQYDASDATEVRKSSYSTARQSARMRGSNIWQTARFDLIDPTFANSQNGGADFRFCVTPPDIYIRRVTVVRQPAPTSRLPIEIRTEQPLAR